MMSEQHREMIYTYTTVVEEVVTPIHAIYYIDGGMGYVETDVEDEGETLSFSCSS